MNEEEQQRVHVVVRVRPFLPREREAGLETIIVPHATLKNRFLIVYNE